MEQAFGYIQLCIFLTGIPALLAIVFWLIELREATRNALLLTLLTILLSMAGYYNWYVIPRALG